MAYAEIADIEARTTHVLSDEEVNVCNALLEDAAVIIDTYNQNASDDAKKVVSCRMVLRSVGDDTDMGIPVGATQGSVSALGYSQSWTVGSGSVGELYLSKLDKKLLGYGSRVGSYSPLESLVKPEVQP